MPDPRYQVRLGRFPSVGFVAEQGMTAERLRDPRFRPTVQTPRPTAAMSSNASAYSVMKSATTLRTERTPSTKPTP